MENVQYIEFSQVGMTIAVIAGVLAGTLLEGKRPVFAPRKIGSDIDYNVFEPGVYGWKEVNE